MSRISKADRQLQLQREAAGDHLYANRVRVYPKAVHGPVRRLKWGVLIACLGLYYLLPWLRWGRAPGQPEQAVLLDVGNERFYFFNLELWPQDIWLLAGLLIMGAVSLFLVTSVIGRVWCGYTCPQTVWTDLFVWVERLIEGDRNERMQRDAAPVSFDTVWRKALKHAVWLGIAFWTGGAWIMYYADAPGVTVAFWTGAASSTVYFFIFLFTATTYLLAGWAREQVCTYMCPWPRFQSAMLDDQSFTVTYQSWRGEPRRRGSRHHLPQGGGDCVDCGACVTACPTGIDIRDGIQMECINCGLCIDACNHVMERTGQPAWLVAWDTMARQVAKAAGRHEAIRLLRPRTIIYVCALLLAVAVMGVALASRATMGLSVQRDRAPMFVLLPDGGLRNGYTVKITNKSQAPASFILSLQGLPDAKLAVADANAAPAAQLTLLVAADRIGTFRVLVTAHPAGMADGTSAVGFVARDVGSGGQANYASVFIGPAAYAGGAP